LAEGQEKEMSDSIRNKQSDAEFVRWSKGTKPQSWDFSYIAAFIDRKGYATGADIGGSVGHFANLLKDRCKKLERIDVIDPSVRSRNSFCGVENVHFLHTSLEQLSTDQKYDFVVVNFVLHHIVRNTNRQTYEAQKSFISKILPVLKEDGVIFIEENIYEGVFGTDLGGRVIYEITKLKSIASLTRKLGANTAGEGVRFRNQRSWDTMFRSVGLRELDSIVNKRFGVSFPYYKKIPLLCNERYQSVKILKPAPHNV
jgi:SAM-dependent methyltransferase